MFTELLSTDQQVRSCLITMNFQGQDKNDLFMQMWWIMHDGGMSQWMTELSGK